jgi:DNA-binding transcriptional LysR family regulator
MMDRLDAMEIFVAVIESGSLAAAAHRLGRSPSTVTRAIALLEQQAGDRLLHRTTRTLKLTGLGLQQLDVFRTILAELVALTPQPSPDRLVTGTLVVTAPELFGRLKALPLIETFLAAHPAASVRVLLLNRIIDLGEEGVDVAIRVAALPDSRLMAVRLGEVRRLICAAPAYLDRKGRPTHPSELDMHECIGHNEAGERELWPFRLPGQSRDRARSFPIRSRLTLNSAGAARDAAMRGHGVCTVLSDQVAEQLADRILEPLLMQFEPTPVPVSFVFHTRPRRDGIMRAFVDHVGPLLRAELERIAGIVSAAEAAALGRQDGL